MGCNPRNDDQSDRQKNREVSVDLICKLQESRIKQKIGLTKNLHLSINKLSKVLSKYIQNITMFSRTMRQLHKANFVGLG